MNSIIVVGGRGHAKVVTEVIQTNKENLVTGFFDDSPRAAVFELPHLGKIECLQNLRTSDYKFICTIGNNKIRKMVTDKINATINNIEWGTFIHQSAIISPTAKIGHGTVIMANAVVNASAVIGNHCIINTGAIIEHDCQVEDYSHVSPNATLCGTVHIGKGVHVGAGSTTIQCLKIGDWSIIGAGAVVVRDIASGVTVKGIPAKV